MKKRPYLLLEVVIAMALVALCAIPLLRPLFAAARRDATHIHTLNTQFRAEQAFTEVRDLLYDNTIPWNALRKGTDYTGTLDDCTYTISEITKFRKRTNTGRDGATYRLLAITIHLDQDYKYQLFAERIYPDIVANS